MGEFVEEPKAGPPAYMVSFCDMMTLILTFFILLVSMSEEQNYGLMAKGVGSFIMAIESQGLPGVLDDADKQAMFEHMRRKFDLPPEPDPERRDAHANAASLELIKAKVMQGLKPHNELGYPTIAVFEEDSAVITSAGRNYLDDMAGSLQPQRGQLLHLEGHANDAGPKFAGNNSYLAFSRAEAVREYLIQEHHFKAKRVEAHAWLQEISSRKRVGRSVDARLITPTRPIEEN